MTYKQLIKRAMRDSGFGHFDDSITDLDELHEESPQQMMADWVNDAWNYIQAARHDWFFLRASFKKTLSAALAAPGNTSNDETLEIQPSALVPDWGAWRTTGVSEQPEVEVEGYSGSWQLQAVGDSPGPRWAALPFVPWGDFRRDYVFADAQSFANDRPIAFSYDEVGNIHIAPRVLDGYILHGDYRRAPQQFTRLTDTPLAGFPARYHGMIQFQAMMYYYLFDETSTGLPSADFEYKQLWTLAVAELTPKPRTAGTYVGI